LGDVAGALVAALPFLLALALSGLTVLISALLHSLVAIVIVLVLGIGCAMALPRLSTPTGPSRERRHNRSPLDGPMT
jgi:hypothetical protein